MWRVLGRFQHKLYHISLDRVPLATYPLYASKKKSNRIQWRCRPVFSRTVCISFFVHWGHTCDKNIIWRKSLCPPKFYQVEQSWSISWIHPFEQLHRNVIRPWLWFLSYTLHHSAPSSSPYYLPLVFYSNWIPWSCWFRTCVFHFCRLKFWLVTNNAIWLSRLIFFFNPYPIVSRKVTSPLCR